MALESQRAADCLDTDEFEESVPFSNRTLFTCKGLYELWNLLEKEEKKLLIPITDYSYVEIFYLNDSKVTYGSHDPNWN